MKWFLCALCCLTEGLSVLRAQIMPDSSVQICAYWTPGDKYAYEAREEKFKIDDQGDTTLVYRQSERRVFEILSQTKDRYKIRLTYGDYMTTDKEDQLVHDAIVSATGPCVVEFDVLFPWGTARFDAGIRIRRDVRSAVGWPGFCAGKDFVLD